MFLFLHLQEGPKALSWSYFVVFYLMLCVCGGGVVYIPVSVCAYMHMCLLLHAGVSTCEHVHVETRAKMLVSSFTAFPSLFERGSFTETHTLVLVFLLLLLLGGDTEWSVCQHWGCRHPLQYLACLGDAGSQRSGVQPCRKRVALQHQSWGPYYWQSRWQSPWIY